jgi:hypothetical protein
MRIRISDPGLTGDLLEYLRRKDWLAIQTSEHIVAASLSNGLPYDAARLELDFQLGDWLLGHRDASAVIID